MQERYFARVLIREDRYAKNIAAFLLVSLAGSVPAQDKPLQLENLSVTYMTRASYYAVSSVSDTEAPSGFSSSENYPRKVTGDNDFPKNAVYSDEFDGSINPGQFVKPKSGFSSN